jgi:hypothetical protein
VRVRPVRARCLTATGQRPEPPRHLLRRASVQVKAHISPPGREELLGRYLFDVFPLRPFRRRGVEHQRVAATAAEALLTGLGVPGGVADDTALVVIRR